jgi:hypothetical protein
MGILHRLFGRSARRSIATEGPVAKAEQTAGEQATLPENPPARWGLADQSPGSVAAVPVSSSLRVKRVVVDEDSLAVLDLRGVKATRTRIVGSAYWVTDVGRAKHGGDEYLLVREPGNKWDANAVAVYGKGRKVGHLSEAKAAALSPIFDLLEFDGFKVAGESVSANSVRMWVDLPSVPALRSFVKSLPQAEG